MNLKNLVVAIAVATIALPMGAQAGVKIAGDIGVAASGDANGNTTFGSRGSEVNVDASETIGGVTYFGHTEIQLDGSPTFDEVKVGVKGGFGSITMGDTDNGCDTVDVGGTTEVWVNHSQGGCKGSDDGNIVYKRGMGPMTFAVSHNMKDGDEHNAIGAKVNLGRIGLSAGYEDLDGPSNVALGGTIGFGNLKLGASASMYDANGGTDTENFGVNFLYTAGGNNIYGGLGAGDQADSWSLGYKKVIGMTDLIAEITEVDGDDDTSYAVGMRHRF